MDIRTLSRAAGVVSVIVAPLVLAIPIEISDNEDAPAAQQLPDYAAHSGVAFASNLVLFALLLIVPAMLATARLARPGAPKLAFVGGALSVLGWLAGLISLGVTQIALYQGAKLPDRTGAAALIDAINGDPVFGTLIGLFVLGHVVGMIILGAALWRSHAVPVWAALLFIAYPVLHFVGHQVNPIFDYVAGVALLISAVVIATRIASTPNSRWDASVGSATPAEALQPVAV